MLRYLRSWFRNSPPKTFERRTRLLIEQLEDRVVPSAVITTDLNDYAPGQTVTLTGTGFQAGEAASINVVGSNGYSQTLNGTSVADANGQFTTTFVVNPGFANTEMTITATGNLGDSASTICYDSGGGLSIAGETFNDLNENGSLDAGEPGLAGWTVYLTTSLSYPNQIVASVTTDGNGDFLFSSTQASGPGVTLVPSLDAFKQYYVFEGPPTAPFSTGWTQSLGGPGNNAVSGNPTNGSIGNQTTAYSVELFPFAPSSTGNNFGNYATAVTLSYVDINSDAADAAIYDGGVQRSMVNTVDYHFASPVSLDDSAITITLHSGVTVTTGSGGNSSSVTGTVGTVPDDNSWYTPDGGYTWVVNFGGAGVLNGGSIADGVYDITLNAAHVTTLGGGAVSLTAYNGGIGGMGNDTETFWCLFGDANATKKVTTQDEQEFVASYLARSNNPAYVAWFDLFASHKVTTQDFGLFANNYLTMYSGFTATI